MSIFNIVKSKGQHPELNDIQVNTPWRSSAQSQGMQKTILFYNHQTF